MKIAKGLKVSFFGMMFFNIVLPIVAEEYARVDSYSADKCRTLGDSIKFLGRVGNDILRNYYVQKAASEEKEERKKDFDRCCNSGGAKAKCDYAKPKGDNRNWNYSHYCRELVDEITELFKKSKDPLRRKIVRDEAKSNAILKDNEFNEKCRVSFDSSGKSYTYEEVVR